MWTKIVLMLLTLVVPAGCRQTPTYQSYGWLIVTVDADSSKVANAVYSTYDVMTAWRKNADGQRSDPSFVDGGRTIDNQDGRGVASIAKTRFASEDGGENVIERISIPGQSMIVLLSAADDHAGMRLYNEFVASLAKAGVKRKDN
jgi:hypothetical protein